MCVWESQSSFHFFSILAAQRRTRRFKVNPTKTPIIKLRAQAFEQVASDKVFLWRKNTWKSHDLPCKLIFVNWGAWQQTARRIHVFFPLGWMNPNNKIKKKYRQIHSHYAKCSKSASSSGRRTSYTGTQILIDNRRAAPSGIDMTPHTATP